MSIIPVPKPLQARSSVASLKERLDWGEPALTIIDIRASAAFQAAHITGAAAIPASELVAQALVNLEFTRDIYVYGETDQQTAAAAASLRAAGYKSVAELLGGLAAWQAGGYPTEGASATSA